MLRDNDSRFCCFSAAPPPPPPPPRPPLDLAPPTRHSAYTSRTNQYFASRLTRITRLDELLGPDPGSSQERVSKKVDKSNNNIINAANANSPKSRNLKYFKVSVRRKSASDVVPRDG